MREFWYTHAGTRLFAVEDGAGDTVVLLHGGMADHRAVLPYATSLTGRFRVVMPDLRGSGRSHFGGALGFDQFADDLEALLDNLDVRRAVVIGVSGGTGAALRFALRVPGRLAGLGLVLPLYAGAQAGYTETQRTIFAGMDALASRAVKQGIEVIRPLYANLPETVRDAAIVIALQFDPASVVATSHLLASGAQPFSLPDELGRITAPTLIVPGADAIHPPAVAESYARALPNARVLPADAIDGSGEWIRFCERCFAMAGGT